MTNVRGQVASRIQHYLPRKTADKHLNGDAVARMGMTNRMKMQPNFNDFAALSGLMFQPTPGQVYADVAGELAILDSTKGVYYGLDPVGARIWTLILEYKTISEIRAVLLEEYDVEPRQLESDISNLLTDLSEKGLIAPATSEDKARAVSQAAMTFDV